MEYKNISRSHGSWLFGPFLFVGDLPIYLAIVRCLELPSSSLTQRIIDKRISDELIELGTVEKISIWPYHRQEIGHPQSDRPFLPLAKRLGEYF